MSPAAIVLAAGRGSRLSSRTEELPKCLLPLEGKALLVRMIEALRGRGVERVAVVVGYRGERIVEELSRVGLGETVETIDAPDWETTNNSMSLLAAAEILSAGAIVVEGDVALGAGGLDGLAVGPDDDAAWLVTPFTPEIDGCCLHADASGRIERLEILRHPFDPPGPSSYKSLGVVEIAPRFGPALVETLERFRDGGRPGDYYDLALAEHLDSHTIRVSPIGAGCPWAEIDDEADYLAAQQRFGGEV